MRKKVLFIDRDGTLVVEPDDCQIDSFLKLEFYPDVFKYLRIIHEHLDYQMVMVSNQDGLDTTSFPQEVFWPIQSFIVKSLKNENISFSDIYIDNSFSYDNLPTRKPGTAMLTKYLNTRKYDLKNSYVIGDRLSDMELAKNLGCCGILINKNTGAIPTDLEKTIALRARYWKEIYQFLLSFDRTYRTKRITNETSVYLEISLDGQGASDVSTGIGFFDHMLQQLSKHAKIDLKVDVKGDLDVDEHHTIEDTAIVLGEAFKQALGDKKGIERYGFCLPMDECLAQVVVDFGGRNEIVWNVDFKREKIGEMPTEMFYHFFKSFSDSAKANIHIKAEGQNEHHKIESIFKAFAKAIRSAIRRDPKDSILPTTKGQL